MAPVIAPSMDDIRDQAIANGADPAVVNSSIRAFNMGKTTVKSTLNQVWRSIQPCVTHTALQFPNVHCSSFDCMAWFQSEMQRCSLQAPQYGCGS